MRYVYEIPNAFIGRIPQAEPTAAKLGSVVKPKTRCALGIAVNFVGDHLKDKKATEFNTLDKLLSEDLGPLEVYRQSAYTCCETGGRALVEVLPVVASGETGQQ